MAAGGALAPNYTFSTSGGSNRITSFCYAAAGDLLDEGACASPHRCTWDAEERMTGFNGNGYTASYSYDALGRRVALRTSDSGAGAWYNVDCVHDLAGRCVSRFTTAGAARSSPTAAT